MKKVSSTTVFSSDNDTRLNRIGPRVVGPHGRPDPRPHRFRDGPRLHLLDGQAEAGGQRSRGQDIDPGKWPSVVSMLTELTRSRVFLRVTSPRPPLKGSSWPLRHSPPPSRTTIPCSTRLPAPLQVPLWPSPITARTSPVTPAAQLTHTKRRERPRCLDLWTLLGLRPCTTARRRRHSCLPRLVSTTVWALTQTTASQTRCESCTAKAGCTTSRSFGRMDTASTRPTRWAPPTICAATNRWRPGPAATSDHAEHDKSYDSRATALLDVYDRIGNKKATSVSNDELYM